MSHSGPTIHYLSQSDLVSINAIIGLKLICLIFYSLYFVCCLYITLLRSCIHKNLKHPFLVLVMTSAYVIKVFQFWSDNNARPPMQDKLLKLPADELLSHFDLANKLRNFTVCRPLRIIK